MVESIFGRTNEVKAHLLSYGRSISLLAMASVLFFLWSAIPAHADDPVTPAPAGYTARFTVKNNCGVNAWMWVTGAGDAVGAPQSDFWGDPGVNKGRKVCKGANATTTTCAGNYNYSYKFVFDAGEKKRFNIPNNGSVSNNLYFALNCVNSTGAFPEWGTCVIGGRPGTDLMGANTLFEATWGCNESGGTNPICARNPSATGSAPPRLTNTDWFDLSLVNAFTVPMKLEANQSKLPGANCKAGDYNWDGTFDFGQVDMDSCPVENWATMWSETATIVSALKGAGVSLLTTDSNGNRINCAAPTTYFGTSSLGSPTHTAIQSGTTTPNEINWYGCVGSDAGTRASCLVGPNGNGTQTVAGTNYVQYLKAMGVNVYTWAYDDSYGNTNCNYGLELTLTLCPNKAGQIPYQDQKWNYSASTNTCVSDANGQYESYFECISINSNYTQQGTGDSASSVVYCVPDPKGKFANYDDCRGYVPASHWEHQAKTGVHARGQKANSTISKTGTPILVANTAKPINGTGSRPWQANVQNSTYVSSVIVPAFEASIMTADMLDRVEVADSADAYGTFTSEYWLGGPTEARSVYAFPPYSFDASLNATAGVSVMVKWMFKADGSANQGNVAGRRVGDVEVYKYMQKYQRNRTAARWTMVYGDGHTNNWSGMVDRNGDPTLLDDGSAFFTTYDDIGTILPENHVFEAGTRYYLWALIQNHAGTVGDVSSGHYDLDNSTAWVFDPPRILADVKAIGHGTSSGCAINPSAGFAYEWLLLLLAPILGIVRGRAKK